MIASIALPPGLEPLVLEPVLTPRAELVGEFFARTASPSQAEIDYLTSRNVPSLALYHDPGADDLGWAVGRAFVAIDEGGLFDFAAEGDEGAAKALCVVARDVSGDPVDIVAWIPKSDRAAAHYGRVALLGEQNVEAFRFDDQHLAAHRSVLGWLRGGRQGVLILDERRAWRVLEGIEVVAEDLEHGQSLRRILTAPTPKILVPEVRAA